MSGSSVQAFCVLPFGIHFLLAPNLHRQTFTNDPWPWLSFACHSLTSPDLSDLDLHVWPDLITYYRDPPRVETSTSIL